MARVLIVDDDAEIRDLIAFKLGVSGFEVTTAADGAAGLAAARRERPDVVVLDVMMPRMSGLDVCRELRDDPATSDLPIILGVTLFAAFFIVFINLIVDLLYGVIDPRVRLG